MSFTQIILEKALQSGNGYITAADLDIVKEMTKTDGLSHEDIEILLAQYQQKFKSVTVKPQIKLVMNKCPKCGSNLPLISKICEYCGHTFEDATEDISADDLMAEVELNLEKLSKISKPSFFRDLFAHYYILFPDKPGDKNFSMDFLGVYSVESLVESDYLFSQKSKIESAKYFIVYGNYMDYVK